MQVDSINVPASTLNPGETYEADGTWIKVKPSSDIPLTNGMSMFVRLTDGAVRLLDESATVAKVARKVVVL